MRRILIIDDNEILCDLVQEVLSLEDYRVERALSGKEGLEKVLDWRPDLIILDITLPDMTGWQVLERMKDEDLILSTHIIMLTAKADIGTEIFGLQEVVEDYVRKPFDNKELIMIVRKVLGETDSEDAEVRRPGFAGRLFQKLSHLRPGTRNDTIQPIAESSRGDRPRYSLESSRTYLVDELDSAKSFDVFRDQVMHGFQGLCITRRNPRLVRERYHLRKTPILWITDVGGSTPSIPPEDLERIISLVSDFVAKGSKTLILLDGIEHLMRSNPVDRVLRMLQRMADIVSRDSSILILPVYAKALKEEDYAMLEREFGKALKRFPSK